jgi:hypothetical protein
VVFGGGDRRSTMYYRAKRRPAAAVGTDVGAGRREERVLMTHREEGTGRAHHGPMGAHAAASGATSG